MRHVGGTLDMPRAADARDGRRRRTACDTQPRLALVQRGKGDTGVSAGSSSRRVAAATSPTPLVVHKRKVADVQTWLREALSGTPLAKYRVRLYPRDN